jgi:hypothetical protein
MGRPVRRAELLRPQAGERLHLVAPGEERQALRIGAADVAQARGEHRQCIVPADGVEDARASLGARAANHGVLQLGRRVLLHDAGAALGTQHALVHRMIRIALDESHFAVLHGDLDAAAAGAHVAGGVFDPVA